MFIHLSAITSTGGLPLFDRTFDSTDKESKIAFVNISTLNAINLFCNVNQAKLYSASTENSKIYWKNIDSITLILILKNNKDSNSTKFSFSDDSLESLLSLIYNLILMFCTRDDLINEQFEKVKSKLKICHFAIDYIIECFINKTNIALQTNCIEYRLDKYILAQSSNDLINSLSAEVDSSFICLLMDMKCVNATANYSEKLLTTIDGQLINLLVQARLAKLSNENLFEIEIYLPHSCPDAISRLVFCQLSKRCSIIMLCVDKPTLDYIGNELIEPLKQHPQNQQLFNQLETKSFVQSEHLVDDRVINFVYFDFESKLFFRNGVFDREKIATLLTYLQIVELNEDREQVLIYSNYRLLTIYRKTDSHLVLIMYPKSMNLNDIKKSGLKTFNEILKLKKKILKACECQ